MGLSVRDWMVIVGVLLVVAVLLDGYRRMRHEWRSQLRMSLSRSGGGDRSGDREAADPLEANSELPNGGARVIARRDKPPRSRIEPRMSLDSATGTAPRSESPDAAGDQPEATGAPAFADARRRAAALATGRYPAEQSSEAFSPDRPAATGTGAISPDQALPAEASSIRHQADPWPAAQADCEPSVARYDRSSDNARPDGVRPPSQPLNEYLDRNGDKAAVQGQSIQPGEWGGDEDPHRMEGISAFDSGAYAPASGEADHAFDDRSDDRTDSHTGEAGASPKSWLEAPEESPAPVAADEVLVINVLARDRPFAGADLLQILLTCDLRFGKMNIFHRYEEAGGKGPLQFSVANIVEPGVFDLDRIDDFTTRGVCFFLTLPGPREPLVAFNYMVETAQCLVRNLNGELRDEAHSVMTAQTLEHCRARIREFERRQLTRQYR